MILHLVGIFLSTLAFGSAGGTSYAVATINATNLQILLIVTVANALVVLFWFPIVRLFVGVLGGRLTKFESKGGNIPMLALATITIACTPLGVATAHILRKTGRKRLLVWGVVGIAAVGHSIIWTLGILGIIPFLPSPWYAFAVAVALTMIILGRAVVKHRAEISEIVEVAKRGGKG